MKKILKLPLWAATAIIIVLLAVVFACGTNKAYSYNSDPNYAFEITSYTVNYTINADRTMQIEEITEIEYQGRKSTGHVHLLPVNAGDRVRSLRVTELANGKEIPVDYTVTGEYSGFIGADIGDYSNKTGERHTYKLNYEYAITRPQNKNAIYLNAIGFGWACRINNANITLKLPEGFLPENSALYIGDTDIPAKVEYDAATHTVTARVDSLAEENGVTFDLFFEDGVLSTKSDYTPYWIIIAACVVLAVLAALKFLVFNKDGITPITYAEAPDGMDPLMMGKLIDNKVDRSDVTSLIFYWANLGYLKINMENESDPELIRIYQELPQDCPHYQKLMYSRLFSKGDAVKVSSLTNTFYTTVDKVTKEVNSESGKLHTGKSMAAAVCFALIGALAMALTPIFITLVKISPRMFTIVPAVIVIPAFVIFALAQTVNYNKLKLKKRTLALWYAGVALLALLFSAIYLLIVPSYVMELLPKFILCVISFAIIMLAVTLISRTPEYVESLNKIMGFRDFIKSAEKDRLETMLESNPEFYYQVLPYAQVLGVSDIWEKKFEGLTVQPPVWVSSYHGSIFNIIVFNNMFRSMNTTMTTAMISRPSSKGYSGGSFRGGSFGGGGGFGHGGGGGFGR